MNAAVVCYLEDFLDNVTPPTSREELISYLLNDSPITVHQYGREGGLTRVGEDERAGRMFDIASGIVPVAEGLLAVAKVDTGACCSLRPIGEGTVWPRRHSVERKVMVRYRNVIPPAANPEPADFQPQAYGLHVITLHAGPDATGGRMEALLTLAFQKGERTMIASFDLNGTTRVYKLFRVNGSDLIEVALGEASFSAIMNCALRAYGREEYDSALGIPNFLDFVAEGLPGLGNYLKQVAEYFRVTATM